MDYNEIARLLSTPAGGDPRQFKGARPTPSLPWSVEQTYRDAAYEVIPDYLKRPPVRDVEPGFVGKVPSNRALWEEQPGLAALMLAGDLGIGGGAKAAAGAASKAVIPLLGVGAARAMRPAEVAGIRAYHGSPHSFDKFSIDKIGTGEGAQAYGHGLYFAENEGVAKQYRDILSGKSRGGSPLNWNDPAEVASMRLHQFQGDKDAAIKWILERRPNPSVSSQNAQAAKFTDDVVTVIREGRANNPVDKGHMYEVNINARPEQFLDWDAPLARQTPELRQKLGDTYGDIKTMLPDSVIQGKNGKWFTVRTENDGFQRVVGRFDGWPEQGVAQEALKVIREQAIPNKTFGEFYKEMNSPLANTERMAEAGIPGIRYKDAGSRGAEGGTSNYVVFNDQLIDIIRKYGIAGLGFMTAMGGAAPQPAQASPGMPWGAP